MPLQSLTQIELLTQILPIIKNQNKPNMYVQFFEKNISAFAKFAQSLKV